MGPGLGGTENDVGTSVDTDQQGFLYLTGAVTFSFDNYFDTLASYTGGFIAKYSPDGDLKWLQGSQFGGFHMGFHMSERKIAVMNGSVAVTGLILPTFGGPVSIANVETSFSHLLNPAFVIKLDTAGNGIWLRALLSLTGSFGQSGCEGWAVNIDASGNIVVLASCNAFLTDYWVSPDIVPLEQIDPGYPAPFLYLMDGTTGTMLDRCHPPAPGGNPGNARWFARSMTLMNDSILATGSYYHEPNDTRRIFTMRPSLSFTVGLDAEAELLSKILLYPNPGKDGFTITGIKEPMNVLVRDAMGRVVHTQRSVFENMPITLTDQGAGVYFIELRSFKGMNRTLRWIKE